MLPCEYVLDPYSLYAKYSPESDHNCVCRSNVEMAEIPKTVVIAVATVEQLPAVVIELVAEPSASTLPHLMLLFEPVVLVVLLYSRRLALA